MINAWILISTQAYFLYSHAWEQRRDTHEQHTERFLMQTRYNPLKNGFYDLLSMCTYSTYWKCRWGKDITEVKAMSPYSYYWYKFQKKRKKKKCRTMTNSPKKKPLTVHLGNLKNLKSRVKFSWRNSGSVSAFRILCLQARCLFLVAPRFTQQKTCIFCDATLEGKIMQKYSIKMGVKMDV